MQMEVDLYLGKKFCGSRCRYPIHLLYISTPCGAAIFIFLEGDKLSKWCFKLLLWLWKMIQILTENLFNTHFLLGFIMWHTKAVGDLNTSLVHSNSAWEKITWNHKKGPKIQPRWSVLNLEYMLPNANMITI